MRLLEPLLVGEQNALGLGVWVRCADSIRVLRSQVSTPHHGTMATLEWWLDGQRIGGTDLSRPGKYTVGREQGCDIELQNESCSSRHAIIVVHSDGRVGIIDTSSNGTSVQNENDRSTIRCRGKTETMLHHGSTLRFSEGSRRFRLRMSGANIAAAAPRAGVAAPARFGGGVSPRGGAGGGVPASVTPDTMALFRKYDANHSGMINMSELQDSLREMCGASWASPQKAQELLRKFDRDGNGKLDAAEFGALVSSLPLRGHAAQDLGGAAHLQGRRDDSSLNAVHLSRLPVEG